MADVKYPLPLIFVIVAALGLLINRIALFLIFEIAANARWVLVLLIMVPLIMGSADVSTYGVDSNSGCFWFS